MSQIPLCTIVISSQVASAEIESLETSLRMSSIKVQKSPSRLIGADDIVLIATVLGGMAAAANLIEYGIKVAKAIKNWRRQLRSQGIEPSGRLESPTRPPLELNQASDEEIDEWFHE